MCGIVAAASRRNIVPVLIEGLRRLEYRGYDSAGVAVLDARARPQLRRLRAAGRVAAVRAALADATADGAAVNDLIEEIFDLVQLGTGRPR